MHLYHLEQEKVFIWTGTYLAVQGKHVERERPCKSIWANLASNYKEAPPTWLTSNVICFSGFQIQLSSYSANVIKTRHLLNATMYNNNNSDNYNKQHLPEVQHNRLMLTWVAIYEQT